MWPSNIIRQLLMPCTLVFCCFFHQLQEITCISLGKAKNSASEPLNALDAGPESAKVKEGLHESGEKFYDLHAFGEDLRLIVSKHEMTVPPHAVAIKRHDARTVSRVKIADLGYLIGYIQSRPGSTFTVKLKDGYMSGVIFTNTHMMTIDGRPDEHLNDGFGHVVTRKKHDNDSLEKWNHAVFPRSLYSKDTTTTKRSTQERRYLEAMLVADNFTTDVYGNFTEQYLMSVAYLLNAVMQDHSIGKIRVIYTVVKLVIVSGYEKGLDIAEHDVDSSLSYLALFASWVKQFNNPDDSNPEHFDQGVLISGRICGLKTSCSENGRGYLGGMCNPSLSVASATAAGLSAALTAAHETGHNFGLGHDSGDCAAGYIMHAGLASGGNAFSWSRCSQDYLQTLFKNKAKMHCLYDVPAKIQLDQANVDIKNLAKNYSADEQCRLMFGSLYSQCGPMKSNCKTLYCRESGKNYCIHRATPPLEGTTCGLYKWCIDGECVDQQIPDPIDGNWGPWSTILSPCSRNCSMGVRHRTRSCDSPKPKYFGKECPGESKGQFETCNTHDCPSGTPSSRLEQCREKSSTLTDYHDESAKCSLRCVSGGSIFYYGTVKDGTLCSKYKDVYDVCVLGKCMAVGCDRKFSRKYYDRCRVCAGDGSTCELVSGTYTTRHTKTEPLLMFTLPIGAANVVMKETQSTYNELGVKDQHDNWVIGPTRVSTTTKYFAGTRIMYERKTSQYPDSITIVGPTTEPLKLMFNFVFEYDAEVSYRYYKPLTARDPTPITFYWNYTMSECSETCAGGILSKLTRCYRADDHTEVGTEHCDQGTEPTGSKPCNTQPCEPRWVISEWSACSASCGPSGTRTRTVQCKEKLTSTDDRVVTDDQCQGVKQKTEEECQRKDCQPDWKPGAWSECSRKKCEGTQTRQLYCKKILVSGEKQDRPHAECVKEKPLNELICNLGVSCYEWRPVYPSCSHCEDYHLDAANSPTYKPVGCYHMKNNLFGPMLSKNNVDPLDRSKTVAECGRYSWERARRVFAVGSEGQCYSAMNSHEIYNQHGKSSKCVDNLGGGDDAVFVYAINGQVLVSVQTCFYVEDDSVVDNAKCKSDTPDPEMKLCCEETCQDYCYKTVDGGYCAIPFIYRGKSYNSCIVNDSGRLWCATTSNHDIDAKGSECQEPCRQRTKSGQCCSFPFIYRGRLYNTCITLNSAEPWCALTSNYDRDFKRGTCV